MRRRSGPQLRRASESFCSEIQECTLHAAAAQARCCSIIHVPVGIVCIVRLHGRCMRVCVCVFSRELSKISQRHPLCGRPAAQKAHVLQTPAKHQQKTTAALCSCTYTYTYTDVILLLLYTYDVHTVYIQAQVHTYVFSLLGSKDRRSPRKLCSMGPPELCESFHEVVEEIADLS